MPLPHQERRIVQKATYDISKYLRLILPHELHLLSQNITIHFQLQLECRIQSLTVHFREVDRVDVEVLVRHKNLAARHFDLLARSVLSDEIVWI